MAHSKWIKKEIIIAEIEIKPILGVRPYGNKQMPNFVEVYADKIVGWRARNIVEGFGNRLTEISRWLTSVATGRLPGRSLPLRLSVIPRYFWTGRPRLRSHPTSGAPGGLNGRALSLAPWRRKHCANEVSEARSEPRRHESKGFRGGLGQPVIREDANISTRNLRWPICTRSD